MRTVSNPAPALEQTPRRPRSFPALFLGCLAALLILTILAIGVGRYAIPPATVVRVLLSKFLPIPVTWEGQAESVIFTLRLPRILAALLVGSALSLSGAAYQGVFKNPLVAPDMLGVSAGACVGASVGILMNASGVGIQVGALLGGLAAVLLATAIPRVIKNQSMMTLVLAGVIISNQRTQAVTEAKLEELTREVREHNHFARRMPVVEEQIRVLSHRIGDLESYHKGAAGAAGDRKEKGL